MIELDSKSYKLLRQLFCETDWIVLADSRERRELLKFKLVTAETEYFSKFDGDSAYCGEHDTGRYKISDFGMSYILYRKPDTVRRWIPLVISAVTLLISIAAFIRTL